MKVEHKAPPRRFSVKGVDLRHVADIALEPDELVTFTTESGAEYDVTRKAWGYYATPSTNGRLREKGLRTALVHSRTTGRRYVLLVEPAKMMDFGVYLEDQALAVEAWLDED